MRVAVNYRGRVQGVGFRVTARQIAVRMGVSGWVRNEQDGSVQLEVQGPGPVVEGYLAEVLAAMGGAVTDVNRAQMDDLHGETAFVVRR